MLENVYFPDNVSFLHIIFRQYPELLLKATGKVRRIIESYNETNLIDPVFSFTQQFSAPQAMRACFMGDISLVYRSYMCCVLDLYAQYVGYIDPTRSTYIPNRLDL